MSEQPGITETTPIAERYRAVADRVTAACARAGRDPAEVAIVAVTKRHPAGVIERAAACGIAHVGENYAQELRDKQAELGPRAGALDWHFIGRLQRNKVKHVAGKVALIHAVDSPALAAEIAKRAAAQSVVQRVLLAVNTGGEEHKSGVSAADARALLHAAATLDGIEIAGLMTMPPLAAAPEDNRPYFRALARLRDELASPEQPLLALSMGTTDDFEVAVEEGATLVRVGTAIFGPRPS